jgi:hypothetical protein
MIAKLARFLGKLRCHVEIWSQRQPGAHEYSDYAYSIPNPEDPKRAGTSLYNLTRGHALTEGRNYVTLTSDSRLRRQKLVAGENRCTSKSSKDGVKAI